MLRIDPVKPPYFSAGTGPWAWTDVAPLAFLANGRLVTPWGAGRWGPHPKEADAIFANFVGQARACHATMPRYAKMSKMPKMPKMPKISPRAVVPLPCPSRCFCPSQLSAALIV